MSIPLLRIFLVLIVLLTFSLACNLPQSGNNLPPAPRPVEPADLEQLEQQLRETLSSPDSEEVSVTVTQEQLTAYLAAELQAQGEQQFTDPVVILTNGQMEVYGKVTQSGIRTDAKIVLQPRIDANGEPKLELISMEIGPFPVPANIRSQFESFLDNLLVEYMIAYADDIRVTDIVVSEGYMTISGIRR